MIDFLFFVLALAYLFDFFAPHYRRARFRTWLQQHKFDVGQFIFGECQFLAFDFEGRKFAIRRTDGMMRIYDFDKIKNLSIQSVGWLKRDTEITMEIEDVNNPSFSVKAKMDNPEKSLLCKRMLFRHVA